MRSCVAALVTITVLFALSADGLAATPPCFGAAARDTVHKCINNTRSVVPTPILRSGPPSSDCDFVPGAEPQPVCTFGASAAAARTHIALIGDSHALQWRAAVDVVAAAYRWRAFSITTSGCPFSAAVDQLPAGFREPCVEWYAQVQTWLREHPEVSTLFVSQHGPTPVTTSDGRTEGEIKMAGFRQAWSSLPPTVRRIIVIRDTPIVSDDTFECVRHMAAEGALRPGPACALARSEALRADPAFTAASNLPPTRYGAVDLTPFFCGPRRCYPVVGGVFTHRDKDHITLEFARSLGPYLLRGVRGILNQRRRP